MQVLNKLRQSNTLYCPAHQRDTQRTFYCYQLLTVPVKVISVPDTFTF